MGANVGTKQFETKRRKKCGTQPETKLEQSGKQVCDKKLKRETRERRSGKQVGDNAGGRCDNIGERDSAGDKVTNEAETQRVGDKLGTH